MPKNLVLLREKLEILFNNRSSSVSTSKNIDCLLYHQVYST